MTNGDYETHRNEALRQLELAKGTTHKSDYLPRYLQMAQIHATLALAAATAAAPAPAPTGVVLAVDLVALDTDDRVLLIRRGHDPYEGLWALPGGRVDDGEATDDAIVREAREETGLNLSEVLLSRAGTWSTPGRDPRGRVVSEVYVAHIDNPDAARAGDDAVELRWVHPSEAFADGLAFDHEDILRHVLAQAGISSSRKGGQL